MNTEGVRLEFKEDGIAEIAAMAALINERTENIGARRLYTMMERMLDEVSFDAPDLTGKGVVIDSKYVKEKLQGFVQDEDLSRYIL
jgi:ATP-dependent HslUV protease ATP-binding subunit HslU